MAEDETIQQSLDRLAEDLIRKEQSPYSTLPVLIVRKDLYDRMKKNFMEKPIDNSTNEASTNG